MRARAREREGERVKARRPLPIHIFNRIAAPRTNAQRVPSTHMGNTYPNRIREITTTETILCTI